MARGKSKKNQIAQMRSTEMAKSENNILKLDLK